MTNNYYRYPHYELWDDSYWKGRLMSPFYPLVQYIGEIGKMENREYAYPVDGLRGEACRNLPYYTKKTNSVAAPDVTKKWEDKGLFYACRSLGGVRWIVAAPLSAREDHIHKMKTLVIYHQEDYSDPYWAMKTLEDYEDYLNMAAEDQDMILMFFVTMGPEKGGYFVEILQEATTCYPMDKNNMFLDVSLFKDGGYSIKDAPDYVYTDENGDPADPDASVTSFGALDIPVLNISGRWPALYCLNRKQILIDDYSNLFYDRERMIHSATAERMSEGIAMDNRFNFATEPEFTKYWDDMGLKFEIHYTKGERWMTFTPKASFDHPEEKLPLLIVMQEVGSGNDHLAVTSINYFYEATKLAAQGEFIALFFVLEDPDSNELLVDVLKETEEAYPIDNTRIYIAGHSHNGMYSMEFYRKHPKLIAAAATMGNTPGFLPPNGNAPGADNTDEKIEASSHEDMPLINMVGTCESGIYFPVAGPHTGKRVGGTGSNSAPAPDNTEERIISWQRRLKAHNCPSKTREEIIASLTSEDSTTRLLGFPADRTDVLYLDGVNHYIGDVKNNDGKYHLRIVGIENLPHMPTSSMIDVAWSFMKRFARDRETGKVIELY